jgi:hypothetical protein
MTVVALDLDLIVNIEAGVFPGEGLLDQFPADLLYGRRWRWSSIGVGVPPSDFASPEDQRLPKTDN